MLECSVRPCAAKGSSDFLRERLIIPVNIASSDTLSLLSHNCKPLQQHIGNTHRTMLLTRRAVSLAIFTATNAFVPPTAINTNLSPFGVSKQHLYTAKAAPGITIAAPEQIKEALANPKTTVVDARKIDEILEAGYLKTPNNQWVHAPCTLEECPLLSVAAESLIRDPQDPVVVYCASGKRAQVGKEFLESAGYKFVLNAGGYPEDMDYLLQQ